MKILVCGDRNYGNLTGINPDHPSWDQKVKEQTRVMRVLDKLSLNWPKTPEDEYGNWLPDVYIIAGAATGVDTVAIDWATVNWCPFKEYPANWRKYGRAAGSIRNQQMLDDGKPDFVVAFMKKTSKGTRDMVRRAQAAGIPIHIEEI